MDAGPSIPAAQRSASGAAVAAGLLALVRAMCPTADDDTQDSLVSYSAAVLGSLVGCGAPGSGPGSVWTVGDRVERRLAARADDRGLTRFKLLRAELSAARSVTHKAYVGPCILASLFGVGIWPAIRTAPACFVCAYVQCRPGPVACGVGGRWGGGGRAHRCLGQIGHPPLPSCPHVATRKRRATARCPHAINRPTHYH